MTSDTGYFWFFDKSNVEVVVKVLDACGFSNQFWVFAAGLTDVNVDMTVTEVATGRQKVYHNPAGTAFRPIQDTNAFACNGGFPNGTLLPTRMVVPNTDPSTALLLNNRYKVEATWRTSTASGVGQAVPITGDTGYFWFFSDTNVEVILKVLNACTFNDRFWVFAGGLTDVAVTLKVTDTVTGTVKTYSNAQGTAFQPIQDTSAFQTCLKKPAFAMATSASDSLLLQAITPAGDRMQYFGGKTPTGDAANIGGVDVRFASGDTMSIGLDAQGRPIRGISSSGVPIEISWLSATTLVFTATSADGANQVSVTVDLAGKAQGHSQALPSIMARLRTRSRQPSAEPRHAYRPFETFASFPLATTTTTIAVTRCSTPVDDALVTMHINPESGLPYTVYGSSIGNGNYQVAIPTSPSENVQKAAEICDSIASKMGYVCTAEEGLGEGGAAYVCPALGAALSGVVTPVVGAAIFAACEGFFAATELYCSTLGASPGPGAPDLAETLCGSLPSLIDRYTAGSVTLRPSAVVPGSGVLTGNAVTAPGTGPFPNFTISTGGELHLGRFTANPADPDPFESYVATVEVFCAPPSTLVTMTIIGTDGYVDSTTCTVTGDETCSLYVPGADAGVVDTVTVRITNGPTRQITLVF